MTENRQINGVVVQGPGVGLAYDEALSLAKRAHACIARGVDDFELSHNERLLYSVETTRMSSRILHVMAWGMYHKAFEAGEIDRRMLRSSRCRLGDDAICLAPPAGNPASLPHWVHDLLDQSARLYRRALRLQAQLDQQTYYPRLS